MDYPPQIENLLNKYWEAETSVEEERELRQYFELHPELADANVAYFLMLSKERDIEAPFIPELPEATVVRPMWKRYASIAAAVALLITAGTVISKYTTVGPETNTASTHIVDDPDEAYAQAKQALLLVSQKMNKSTVNASSKVEKVTPYTTILK